MKYDNLHKLVDCEMEKIASKPELNDAILSNLYRLVDVKKDLLEIEEEEMNMGMSERGGGRSSYRPYYGNSNGYNGYTGGNSGYNGYTDYDYRPNVYPMAGNSMDDGRQSGSYRQLEEAMRHATSESEREAIRQLMDKFYK